MTKKANESRKLRADLSPQEREKAERIGSVDFKSAGAKRKNNQAPCCQS